MLMQHTWILKSNRSKATMIQMICSTDTPTQYYIKNVYRLPWSVLIYHATSIYLKSDG